MQAVAAGDIPAREWLFATHVDLLLRVAVAHGADPASAEDAVQEAFVEAFSTAGTFRGRSPVRHWMLGVLRHTLSRQRRLQRIAPAAEADVLEVAERAGFGLDTSSVTAALEDRDVVRRVLAVLDPVDRLVLELRDAQGLTGDEAAAALGIGLAAEKSRLHRARLAFVAAAMALHRKGNLGRPE